MPIISKYDVARQERLMDTILEILATDEAPQDLALMTLGNVATHILNTHVAPEKREAVARQFGQILLQSVTQQGS
ncbi:YejL family protein [Aliidiomarina indica]|uniref:DUF1414 domain-containing protein n=1 Tax=Aliidiomarina indica TaxID=2749147 RepID=UPI00188E60D8|nr:DUF1414 domain-containing protein [Aliidiomarina indica]